MLQQISTTQFIGSMLFVTAIYYMVVGGRYYRREIRQWLGRRGRK